ncbi:MAG: ribosome maturation factor RimP [bacterium]
MEILARLEELILPYLEKKGYELVELRVVGAGKGRVVQVFIWKDGGVTIEDCRNVSENISDILDGEELFEERYYLEVSSPGLDRPLRTLKDFRRAIGEKITLYTVEGNEDIGVINDVSLDGVELVKENEKKLYPWSSVSMGKIIVEFK